jgi:hypothetical protein
MAASADDLRYFYAETIGATSVTTATAATAVPLAEALEPGRYILRVLDYGGGTALWVRQGPFGNVTAAAAAPSTQFQASTLAADLNAPLITFMVRGDNLNNPSMDNGLSFFSVGGNAVVHVTKVSRYKA